MRPPSAVTLVALRAPMSPLARVLSSIAIGVVLIPEQALRRQWQLQAHRVSRPFLLGASVTTPPLLTFTPQQRIRHGLLPPPMLSVEKQTLFPLLLICRTL